MRLFDFVLFGLIVAIGAATFVVFRNDSMPYPVAEIPLEATAKKHRAWAGIWIHSSGSRKGSAATIATAHGGTLPFHFVIGNGTESADGGVEEGPLWGAEKPGKNPDVIEVCLVGDLENHRPTRGQEEALSKLLVRLCRERMIPSSEIYAESEKKIGTPCPGRFFNADYHRTRVRAALGG